MNLLSILAEFRRVKPESIEWNDGDRDSYGYVRFEINNAHEHYEVTLVNNGDGTMNVVCNELP